MPRLLLPVAVLIASMLGACTEKSADAPTQPVVLHFNVQGMHCTGCEDAIESKIVKLHGVTACEASHVDGDVSVTATDHAVASQIIESITELGYTGELVEDAAESDTPNSLQTHG